MGLREFGVKLMKIHNGFDENCRKKGMIAIELMELEEKWYHLR